MAILRLSTLGGGYVAPPAAGGTTGKLPKWAAGAALADSLLSESGTVVTAAGDVAIGVAGKGLLIKEGSNARMGTVALVNGTATVSTTAVTASSRIFLTRLVAAGTTRGILAVGTIVAATSFVINSEDLSGVLSADDDSTVAWVILEPAA